MTTVERNAWFWSVTNARILSFLSTVPASLKFDLPAAAIFHADIHALSGVFEFIGVEAPPPSGIRKALRRRMNASKELTLKTVRWSEREECLARPIVESVASRLGYSL
jgi:hypothetical protein